MNIPKKPSVLDLVSSLFSSLFSKSYQVNLEGGHSEPQYIPSSASNPMARLCFRENFVRSALHEIAHWCLTSEDRFHLVDFGFTYLASPRTHDQQLDFLRLEGKPQALEKIFCDAFDIPFTPSLDHFDDWEKYQAISWQHIKEAEDVFLRKGLPERASQFLNAIRLKN